MDLHNSDISSRVQEILDKYNQDQWPNQRRLEVILQMCAANCYRDKESPEECNSCTEDCSKILNRLTTQSQQGFALANKDYQNCINFCKYEYSPQDSAKNDCSGNCDKKYISGIHDALKQTSAMIEKIKKDHPYE